MRDWGAKGDGATDDTASIQAAYNAAPGTGAVVVFPQGAYIIAAAIVVPRSNIVTEGCNSEIRTTSATADHFQLAAGAGPGCVPRPRSGPPSPSSVAQLGPRPGQQPEQRMPVSMANYAIGAASRLWNGLDFSLGVPRLHRPGLRSSSRRTTASPPHPAPSCMSMAASCSVPPTVACSAQHRQVTSMAKYRSAAQACSATRASPAPPIGKSSSRNAPSSIAARTIRPTSRPTGVDPRRVRIVVHQQAGHAGQAWGCS